MCFLYFTISSHTSVESFKHIIYLEIEHAITLVHHFFILTHQGRILVKYPPHLPTDFYCIICIVLGNSVCILETKCPLSDIFICKNYSWSTHFFSAIGVLWRVEVVTFNTVNLSSHKSIMGFFDICYSLDIFLKPPKD